VLQPVWSPTGDRVAYIAAEGDRRRALRVLDTATGRTTEVVPPSDERAVVEFAWAPDGASLLFTEGGTAVGAVSGVDLWRVDAGGGDRQLIASAGSVAPVARIANVRPSPDGRAVAYEVLVPGSDGARVDSVWVRDLESRQGFRLDVPAMEAVNDLWWTNTGLSIWADGDGRTPAAGNGSQVLRVDASGVVEVLWSPPVSRGTPVSATPRATPDAP
jgi:dipeptidyl aminopeptidase/acylaminoacyl peptidase